MTTAAVKKVTISGTGDADKLVKLDISTFTGGGSIGYQDVEPVPNKTIDDAVTIQGLNGVVNKVGTSASRSSEGSIVSADLGNKNAKKSFSIFKPVDDATFKPYLLDDIVSCINTLSVTLHGYNLMLEEYSFSGKTIDCLNEIASLIYGTVEYVSSLDSYIIIGGDTTYNASSINGGTYIIQADDLISWERTIEKNTTLVSFGSDLIAAAKELARLRAAILDIKDQASIASKETRELCDVISFDFGTKNGPQQIPNMVEIESIHWDVWYFDGNSRLYTSESGNTEFVQKQKYYFTEIIRAAVTSDTSNGINVRGKARGLRSIGIGTTIWFRLKNIPPNTTVYGKGYLTNLASLGLPSITKYKADAAASGSGNAAFDDCYHVLYNISLREVMVKESEYSQVVNPEYIPYLGFTLDPALYNYVQSAVAADKTASGNNAAPTALEIDEALLKHQFSAQVEIMTQATSYNLKYKGYLDSYGRLISDSGQVQLIKSDSGLYFYGPLEGMDMSFTTTNIEPYKPPLGGTVNPLLNDYFDEAALDASFKSAYRDLKNLCVQQPPIGSYLVGPTGYPAFIYEYVLDTTTGAYKLGSIVGVVYGIKEATSALSLSNYDSSEKQKKQLERKIKCLESKINLIIKCIKKADPSSTVSISLVKSILKVIIKYNTILGRVKNESLNTMIALRSEYEQALNDCLTMFNGDTNAKVNKLSVSMLLPPNLPAIGSGIKLPSTISNAVYTVKAVNVSGVTVNINGEYNG